jgi:thymidylate kinase
MSIFVLEGGVCAGKTTTARQLISKFDRAELLADYTTYVDDFEYANAASLPDKYRLRFFLRLEDARKAHIGSSPEVVVVDRSIFTLIGYEYALMKTGQVESLVHVEQQLPLFNPLLPDHLVFLDVSDLVRQERASRRGTFISSPLLDSDFNKHLREFFVRACDRWAFSYIETSRKPAETVFFECLPVLESKQARIEVDELTDFVKSL